MSELQKDELYKEQEYLLFHEKFEWFIGKLETKDKEIQSLTEQLRKCEDEKNQIANNANMYIKKLEARLYQ